MPSPLNSDQYGIREMRLGGAPMSRAQWEERHENHDVRALNESTAVPQIICFTCWTMAVERIAIPAPPLESPDAPVPGSDDASTKGKKK